MSARKPKPRVIASRYETDRIARERVFDKEAVRAAPTEVDFASWDGDVAVRRIRITHGDLTFEGFGTPATSRRLFVFLSGGGGARKDGVTTDFARVSWHPWFPGVCLNLDDPTYSLYPDQLQTGWYIGSESQDGLVSAGEIVRRVQSFYGVDDSEVVIIGSSSGGNAALRLAARLSKSLGIAENPPLDVANRVSARDFTRIGIDLAGAPYDRRIDMGPILDHAESRFLILQNWRDTSVLSEHVAFLKEAGLPYPRHGINVHGSLTVYAGSIPAESAHHTFLDQHEYRSVLRAMRPAMGGGARSALLDATYEGARARIQRDDQIAHFTAWAGLLAALDVPEFDALPVPTGNSRLRFPLRSAPEVEYRARLERGARAVSVAVDVPTSAGRVRERAYQRVLELDGVHERDHGGHRTVSISKVSIGKAPEAIRSFVGATARLFR